MATDKDKEPRSWQRSVLLYVHDLMCMLLAVMLLFLVVFRVILVTGDSMFSTLWDGDYLLLESRMFCGEPEPGTLWSSANSPLITAAPSSSGSLLRKGRQWILILKAVRFT